MILVTGGAGFIGSNFVYYMLNYVSDQILIIDKLTYASDYRYIEPAIKKYDQVLFEKVDICDELRIKNVFTKYDITHVFHFAAESHVDNSIRDFYPFYHTNVMGTAVLLDVALKYAPNLKKFIHVSTDEVYGSLPLEGGKAFTEETVYAPNNPYSASKAASDHFVRAYNKTFNLPTIITHCSNNYGPGQNEEKFIPTIVRKAIANESIPVYGDGLNVRDWLFVDDHCRALNYLMYEGRVGEVYNIGGGTEISNIELVKKILKYLNKSESLITFVPDRKGHDRRYAIDYSKLKKELSYEPLFTIDIGLTNTIEWYEHGQWSL